MRMTQLLTQTQRQAPATAEVASHQLLLQAGYIRQEAAGIFSMLHLGQRTVAKIKAIMRAEMATIGGQEVAMPVVHPASLWQASARWYKIDNELGRFEDRNGRSFVLALSHEETATRLAQREIRSYRQLPRLIYHIQTKWRDDPRPRAGLIRAREFTMLDSYSFDLDAAGLDAQYQAHYDAYFRIFARCGLDVIAVAADVGMMGGTMAHEYMYLTPIGEDTLLLCAGCDYTANRQIAIYRKPQVTAVEQPLAQVHTPGATTVAAVATALDVAPAQVAKSLFLIATDRRNETPQARPVIAVLRGDQTLNETKLRNVLEVQQLRPAREDEITALGSTPGFASPVGLEGVQVVVDDGLQNGRNLVAGANLPEMHLTGVQIGRDILPDLVADIATAQEGDLCTQCGSPLHTARGVEVANIFKLGTHYSSKFDASVMTETGEKRPFVMGCYGIGVGRLLACIAESHHDAQGLIWPQAVAPYAVHLVALPGGTDLAAQLYTQLQAAGIETLYDDRDLRAGAKFNDADLIGLPFRVTVSGRSRSKGGVECKQRQSPTLQIVAPNQLAGWLRAQGVSA